MEEHQSGTTVFHTSDDFWDCECDENYIHSKLIYHCPECGAEQDDQPDARIEEIETLLHYGKIRKELLDNFEKNAKELGIYETNEPVSGADAVDMISRLLRDMKYCLYGIEE